MHNDKLLLYVVEQIETDLHNGEVEAVMDLLEYIPREALLAYLGLRLAQQVVNDGLATMDEVEGEE